MCSPKGNLYAPFGSALFCAKRIQGTEHKNGIGIDDWYEASGLAGMPFPKLKTRFRSDLDSGIQNPPTGPSRAAMCFYHYDKHVVTFEGEL